MGDGLEAEPPKYRRGRAQLSLHGKTGGAHSDGLVPSRSHECAVATAVSSPRKGRSSLQEEATGRANGARIGDGSTIEERQPLQAPTTLSTLERLPRSSTLGGRILRRPLCGGKHDLDSHQVVIEVSDHSSLNALDRGWFVLQGHRNDRRLERRIRIAKPERPQLHGQRPRRGRGANAPNNLLDAIDEAADVGHRRPNRVTIVVEPQP